MEQPKLYKRRRISPWILGILVTVLLTVLLLLQSSNLWKKVSVDTASDTLLLYGLSSLNFIAFVIFGFIFLRSIIKLARERRAFQLGSRIKTRLLLYFVMISILPIIAMAGFSYLFMNRAMERWFTQIPENALRESREMQKRTLSGQAEKLQFTARMLAFALDNRDFDNGYLNELAESGNLIQIRIISKDNKFSNESSKAVNPENLPELAEETALLNAGDFDNRLLHDGRGIDAAVAEMSDGRRIMIVPNLRIDESVGQMVDNSLAELDRLKEQQITVRQIGFLTLGFLTFLLIFASTWTAFYIARGLTVPIKALAEGADEIARGNFTHRVDVLAEDELALLVSIFNEMTGKLERNSAELIERKNYIETVLAALPTGVISFDSKSRVTTINKAAVEILKLENANTKALHLDNLVSEENKPVIVRLISRAKRIGHASEQTELQLINADDTNAIRKDMPVALTAIALPDENGSVMVIEDLSELISAQRASAWQEVARRMAHEIKNPLTPIQLSAERIAKRFAATADSSTVFSIENGKSLRHNDLDAKLHVMDDQTRQVINDGTTTILREVASLKSMVDEFSRFARLPAVKLEKGDLNDVTQQVIDLYENRTGEISIVYELAENLPTILIDVEQMKRAFVNLMENAIEAFEDFDENKTIIVRTRSDFARGLVIAEFIDNGKGVPLADIQKLFQPYFSTKGRGTGIGLAIVQRIISEHRGKIQIHPNAPKGSKFLIELPMIS